MNTKRGESRVRCVTLGMDVMYNICPQNWSQKQKGIVHLAISRHVLDYNIEVHIIEVWDEGVN
jgi:hypothetical protein